MGCRPDEPLQGGCRSCECLCANGSMESKKNLCPPRAFEQASFSNHVSFYGCSMYQLVMEEEFLGTPYDSQLYWERSPLRFVKQVETPVLLTQ